jgi:TRAP-type mannitol/chloroaromatic compound transport system permease small subunit
MAWLRRIDSFIAAIVSAGKWLALPLVALLFLQWPLRDIFRAYSREANDLGQLIFALYVAISVTAATRAGTHLAADALAQRYSGRRRRQLARLGAALGLVPWSLWILLSSRSLVASSVAGLESFPDSNNPGYFLIKAALWVLALLVLGQTMVEIFRPARMGD